MFLLFRLMLMHRSFCLLHFLCLSSFVVSSYFKAPPFPSSRWLMCARLDQIYVAIGKDDVLLLEKLLTPQNVNAVENERRMTLLMYAVNLGKYKAVDLLIKSGASLFPRDLFQFNVVHHAAWRADIRIMKRLLCNDGDDFVATCSSPIPLKASAKKLSFRPGTRSLVDLPHPLTNRTPLMLAAMRGDVDMVDFLLTKAGADVHLKDCGGHNAMDLAARFGHKRVVTYLLSKGDEIADKAFENARQRAEENCENAVTVHQLQVLKELNILLCEDWLPQSLVGFSR